MTTPEKQLTTMKTSQRSLSPKWREMFRRHRRMHDPMLVLNMSIFNFDGGWNRTFNLAQNSHN